MPRDALLLSMSPHLDVRGVACEYSIVQADGSLETLLRVKPYDSSWQMSYPLKTPKSLPKGARLTFTGTFNSSPNPGEETMIGFFDIAVEANVDRIGFVSSPTP
jgi:hypothetical protein